MKESIKRFFATLLLIVLSVGTALFIDDLIYDRECKIYPLGEEESVRETVSKYSESYGIPEQTIYTVMKMRSGCNRYYDSDGRIGYMGLDLNDVKLISDLYDVKITDDMLRNPSYNLLFGVQILSRLYSHLGDWNAVYAALLYGESNAAEWLSDGDLIDVTGKLISVPPKKGDEFYEYLKTEKKYVELYFSDKK